MTSSFGMGSHQATLEEDVTLLNGQTSSSLTGRTSGLPQEQLQRNGVITITQIKKVLPIFLEKTAPNFVARSQTPPPVFLGVHPLPEEAIETGPTSFVSKGDT